MQWWKKLLLPSHSSHPSRSKSGDAEVDMARMVAGAGADGALVAHERAREESNKQPDLRGRRSKGVKQAVPSSLAMPRLSPARAVADSKTQTHADGPMLKTCALLLALVFAAPEIMASSSSVRVEILSAAPRNAPVTRASSYAAQVTLSIENADGSLTPSGWSTRKENGGDGRVCSECWACNLSRRRSRCLEAGSTTPTLPHV